MDFTFLADLFPVPSVSGDGEDPIEHEGDPKGSGPSTNGYCVVA
ncbi:hypothetical protein RSAG8_05346, partial [Rhizoctonia solani AG-8 WAC10335]